MYSKTFLPLCLFFTRIVYIVPHLVPEVFQNGTKLVHEGIPWGQTIGAQSIPEEQKENNVEELYESDEDTIMEQEVDSYQELEKEDSKEQEQKKEFHEQIQQLYEQQQKQEEKEQFHEQQEQKEQLHEQQEQEEQLYEQQKQKEQLHDHHELKEQLHDHHELKEQLHDHHEHAHKKQELGELGEFEELERKQEEDMEYKREHWEGSDNHGTLNSEYSPAYSYLTADSTDNHLHTFHAAKSLNDQLNTIQDTTLINKMVTDLDEKTKRSPCFSTKTEILGCVVQMFHVNKEVPFFYYGLNMLHSRLFEEVCGCPLPIIESTCPPTVQKIARFMEAHCHLYNF